MLTQAISHLYANTSLSNNKEHVDQNRRAGRFLHAFPQKYF